MELLNANEWLQKGRFNEQGLVAVIAQDLSTKDVLMMAWMNAQTLEETVCSGQAVYWSRSRGKRWHKGEESGHFQNVKEVRLDCDGDTILLMVEQVGGIACHTGAPNCFFQPLQQKEGIRVWGNQHGENNGPA
jgi:phosphoribosyl-AMP cyclohydrolase